MIHAQVLLIAGILLGLSACGQGTDPLATLGDSSQSQIGTLVLPISSTLTGFNPFSSASDGFDLIGIFTGTVTAVRSPGAGLVIAVDPGAQTVTILHNIHVVSRIRSVSSSVQVGNYIPAGFQIGTVANLSNTVHFSIFVDGVAVCPMSFLSPAARKQMATSIYSFYTANGGNPCLE